MMAKPRVSFVCCSCGGVQSKWMGKCPDCGTWDALERFVEPKVGVERDAHSGLAEVWRAGMGESEAAQTTIAVPLPAVESAEVARTSTGIDEFDRVLGGGLVAGSVVLLGGDPGIGKSTLLLQMAGAMAAGGDRVLYVTSEESAYQTRLRAERLFDETDDGGSVAGLDDLYILADTNLARILEQTRAVTPGVLIIDSIQMVYKSDIEASPGSVTQLRGCCMDLVYLAKLSGMSVLLIGHVTKQGQLAGPKLLEHLVDTVLNFEGDRHHAHRIVRAAKNRYGTTLEVAIFEMTGRGLAEVADGALQFDPNVAQGPGSVVCPAMHGSRCLLVEVQALTATGLLGAARRKVSGLDSNRLAMLIAILERHGGLRLADQDIFVSAVGGLKVVEPAADLALILAIAGAHLGRALPPGFGAIGEVGLDGTVRSVSHGEQRRLEARRLGYRRLIVPGEMAGMLGSGPEVHAVRRVSDALEMLDSAQKSTPRADPDT